jgi:hypothetical protein
MGAERLGNRLLQSGFDGIGSGKKFVCGCIILFASQN